MARLVNNFKTKRLIVSLGLLLVVLALVFTFLLTPMTVKGNSMEPIFRDGQIVLVDRVNYNFSRGDIIVFERNNVKSIKKIVAIEGDTVELTNGELFINDDMVLKNVYFIDPFSTTIKTGEFFVLGENVVLSEDSFSYGAINKNCICGKVIN